MFQSGRWIGFFGNDMDAVVDLGSVQTVSSGAILFTAYRYRLFNNILFYHDFVDKQIPHTMHFIALRTPLALRKHAHIARGNRLERKRVRIPCLHRSLRCTKAL